MCRRAFKMSTAVIQGSRELLLLSNVFRVNLGQRHLCTLNLYRTKTAQSSTPSLSRWTLQRNSCPPSMARGARQGKSRKAPAEKEGRSLLPPGGQPEGNGIEIGFRGLVKPFGFTILVSGFSFAGAAIWQYENLRSFMKQRGAAAQQTFYGKSGNLRQHLNHFWNELTPSRKAVACIIGINTCVLLMWRFVPLHIMSKWFTASPASGAPCWSMLLSCFSHFSVVHLAANMYVLWSFSPAIATLLGKEQFMAMFISAGMVSSLTSYAHKVARGRIIPSLGASGAIMAVLGAVCIKMPESRLSVALVDQIIPHSFTAKQGLYFILALDTAGLLFGWRLFDHAAHLGGMLFGMWYATYGHKIIWKAREPFIKKYHELRGKS